LPFQQEHMVESGIRALEHGLPDLPEEVIPPMTIPLAVWWVFRFRWGADDAIFGGLMGLGHVTPPAWRSTRSL